MSEPSRVRIVLPPVPDAELLAARAVQDVGGRLGFSRDTLEEVKLAVVEACLNALEHGAGEVEVEVLGHRNGEGSRIEVLVTDHGPGFEPGKIPAPQIEVKLHGSRKRGWGLELMRHLMDAVEVVSKPGYTQVRMLRRRGGK